MDSVDQGLSTLRDAMEILQAASRVVRIDADEVGDQGFAALEKVTAVLTLFAKALGQPLDERNVVNRHFKPALERAKLPKTVRLYDLRHTAATLMLASGTPVRAVADRLGHSSAKMTLDVYAHTLAPQAEQAAAALEAALFGEG